MVFASLYSIYVIIAFTLAYVVYKYLLYPALLSSLREVPAAHPLAPWTPLWILYKRVTRGENQLILQAHRKLGDIIRVSPDEVSINCLEGLKAVYGGNYDKHHWFTNVAEVEGVSNAFSTPDAKSHAQSRRLFTNIYSKSFVQTSTDVREMFEDMHSNSLMPVLRKSADQGQPVDMINFSCAIAYDYTSRFMFGSEGGTEIMRDMNRHGKILEDHDWLRPYFVTIGELLTPITLLEKFGIKMIPSAVFEAHAERVEHVSNMCKAAKANPGSKAFVYDQASLGFDKSPLSCPKDLKVLSELYDQLLAGLETTAPALIYLTYELSQNTHVQDKLRAELATVKMNGIIPDIRDLDSLPLLDAIILETTRRHPPVPLGLPRVVPKGGVQLCGYSIPEGTRISANAFSLHHNERAFVDSETWNPDRWLKSDQEQVKEMKKWFWTFGSGARMCLGLHLAQQVLKYATAAMYTDFKTSIAEAGDMTQLDGFIGRPVGNKLDIKFEYVVSEK